jgi:NitT/TauT family transport system substrate-binding protein
MFRTKGTSMRHKALLAGGAAVAMLLSACGGDGDGQGDAAGGDAGLIKITAGIIPISNLTPFHVAQEMGFFEDQGLEVETTSATGGGALTAALTGGSVQFAYSNLITPVVAAAGGVDLTIVAGQNAAQTEGEDAMALVVAADSEFQTVADLRGQLIAVNTLKNANEIATDAVLEDAGVSPDEVQYIEMPFPEMANALIRGDIAAANLVEPFRTLVGDQLRELTYPFVDVEPGLDIARWIASSSYVEENPEIVEKFTAALDEANQYLNDDPEEKVKWTAAFTESDPELIRNLTLDRWVSTIDVDSFQRFVDLGVRFGILDQEIDVTTLLYETAIDE